MITYTQAIYSVAANIANRQIPNTQAYTSGGVRQSNLELLRIVAMLLVLLIHYSSVHFMPSEFSMNTQPFKTIANMSMRSLSFVCVNCFVLISGYFGIRWKARSICNLVFQIAFWLCIGILIARCVGLPTNDWTSVLSFVNGRWFVPAYIALYMVSPLLNAFVTQNTAKDLGKYLVVFYIFSTIFGYFMLSKEFNEGMSLISLIGIYLTGAYLRRDTSILTRMSAKVYLVLYFLCGTLLLTVSIVLYKIGLNASIYGYLNPVIIIQSVFLFLFFDKLNIGNHRWINFIAASAFAVYLFHMHPMIYGRFQEICKLLIDNTAEMITIPMFFILIFLFCVSIDRIRIIIFNLIYPRQ